MASAEFKYIPQTAATIFAFSSVQYKSFFYSTVQFVPHPGIHIIIFVSGI